MQTLNHWTSIDFDRQFDSIYLAQTVDYYETVISQGDERDRNYFYLGLAYLLQEREIDAQATWFIPFNRDSATEVDVLVHELVTILDQISSHKLSNNELDDAWLIGQHLREVDAMHVNNLFRSILIEIKLHQFTPELLVEWQADEMLSTGTDLSVDRELLAQIFTLLLNFPDDSVLQFIHQCLLISPRSRTYLIEVIGRSVKSLAHQLGANSFLTEVLEICRNLEPENTIILQVICYLYSCLGNHQQAIDIVHALYALCDTLPRQIVANHAVLKTLLSAGDWENTMQILQRHTQLLESFVGEKLIDLEPAINQSIMVSIPFLMYAADRAEYYRSLQNQIAKIYLQHQQPQSLDRLIEPAKLEKHRGMIRIGYVGSTMRSHSVGWLSRWLWQYHDRQKFQIFTYCINQNPDDPFYQIWFRDRSDVSYCCSSNAAEIAAQIRADEIDILIDLDSLTLDITCAVLAAKPAPVQVSWLGWDATGLSTIDYFIGDPYVLPDHAQDYYQEKIWRLPQCYVAVDGFESGTPTISRADLDIPGDAIVYWSGQRGYKRHPDTVRAQLRILKSVPNSYFLIKGDTDPTIIEEFFGRMAAEEEIDFSRLRFLGSVADEYTHRANLAIADVVLDTFPYNGATTTLETLWMGIPMVTQVGQQFAARNSYTFMLNAGITEGIAWSEQEYIDWGIKLGLDRELRWQIKGKLHAARATAPVWNAKQFTLDMEQAYREMWAKYQALQHDDEIDLHENN
jgi:predicted O-linked N-acetylglucosamine transferase (SPINDLY family)